MKERCESCIFGPDVRVLGELERSPISAERFADLREQWTRLGAETYQVCHQSATWDVEEGPTPEQESEVTYYDCACGNPPHVHDYKARVCLGFYEEMYVKRGVPVQALQVAERLGLLE